MSGEAGDLTKARQAYVESLQMRRQLVTEYPVNAQDARGLSLALDKAVIVFRDAGDLGQARQAAEECLLLRFQLYSANTDSPRAAHDYSLALSQVGEMAREAGDRDRAFAAFDESLRITRRLYAANPSGSRFASDLSIVVTHMASMSYPHGDFAPKSWTTRWSASGESHFEPQEMEEGDVIAQVTPPRTVAGAPSAKARSSS